VTHDQAEAMTLSDRVVLMNKGRVEQVAHPFEMYERPNGRFSSTFLGKANVLKATRAQPSGSVEVQGHHFPTTDVKLVGPLEYIVRPEKLEFAAAETALIRGRVCARVFHGNHWLFQIETSVGTVHLTHANTGLPQANEGDEVGIQWSAENARVVARSEDEA